MDTASNAHDGNASQRAREEAAEAAENFHEAKNAAMEAYANLLEAKRKFLHAARSAGLDLKDNANEQLEEAVGRVQERGTEIYERTEDYVRENPLASAGIAFAAGFIMSRLLR